MCVQPCFVILLNLGFSNTEFLPSLYTQFTILPRFFYLKMDNFRLQFPGRREWQRQEMKWSHFEFEKRQNPKFLLRILQSSNGFWNSSKVYDARNNFTSYLLKNYIPWYSLFLIYIYTLLVCYLFVTNKRQNDWTDRAQILCGTTHNPGEGSWNIKIERKKSWNSWNFFI